MFEIETTRMSVRGQIVIPKEIREGLKLTKGKRLLVLGLDDRIIIKRAELTEKQLEFIEMMERARRKAEKVGFTEKEINELIQRSRRER